MIGTANIPTYSDEGNVYTEKCKIFNLGVFEVGFYLQSGTNYVWMPNDGAKLDYFIKGNTTSAAKERRIAYWRSTAREWTLRSVRSTGYYDHVWEVKANGEGDNGYTTNNIFNFFRPTWIFQQRQELKSMIISTSYPHERRHNDLHQSKQHIISRDDRRQNR